MGQPLERRDDSDGGGEPLLRVGDVPDGGARGISVTIDGAVWRLIVVRRGDVLLAYENRCPHRGTPLDWAPDRFLDREGRHLVCATHGALFRPEDGVCVAGPCSGDALRPIALELRDGAVWALSPAP